MHMCEVCVCVSVVGHKALRAVVDGRHCLIVMDNDVQRDKNTENKIFMLAFFFSREVVLIITPDGSILRGLHM